MNGRIDAMQIENNRRLDTMQAENNRRFDQRFEALRITDHT